MDAYTALKFAHYLGFLTLTGGLIGVFIAEWRAHVTHDVTVFAEAARYTVIFYDAVVVPGAVVIAASGVLLVLHLEIGFFSEPWLVGMWGLFVFEFVEGNTLTRVQFRRTLRHAPEATAAGTLTPEIRRVSRTPVGIIAHFLDLPLVAVMIYCGVARPESWAVVGLAILIAIAVAIGLAISVPRLHRGRSA